METGNHLKNGASPKSHTSKGNLLRITLTVTATLLALTSFANDILTLNNEMVFNGKITKIKKGTVVFKAD
jgi:hypothetical protein